MKPLRVLNIPTELADKKITVEKGACRTPKKDEEATSQIPVAEFLANIKLITDCTNITDKTDHKRSIAFADLSCIDGHINNISAIFEKVGIERVADYIKSLLESFQSRVGNTTECKLKDDKNIVAEMPNERIVDALKSLMNTFS